MFVVGPVGLGQVHADPPADPRGGAHNGRDLRRREEHRQPLPAGRSRTCVATSGTVFQDFKLLPDKTVFENVAFALDVIGKPKHVIKSRVPEIIDLVGLKDKMNHYPNELSGGEQQRVSIARAFVNRPLILLADEPTGNLDPATSVDIMKLLDRINRTGTTVVMATHDNAIVDAMRRRVIELTGGKVVRDQERGVYGYGA